MKLYLILITCLYIAGCSDSVSEHRTVEPQVLKKFMRDNFEGLNYVYKDISLRGNNIYGDKYALFRIKKTDLEFEEMNKYYKKLMEKGWRLVDTNQKNYYFFCYGRKTTLTVIFPLKSYEVLPSGETIYFQDDDGTSWNIFLDDRSSNVMECTRD